MSSSNDLNAIAKQLISGLGLGHRKEDDNSDNTSNNGKKKKSLSSAEILVIAGLLGGTLEVDSLNIDRAQDINIILTGSLKRKTQMDKVMDQIGQMPFDEVVKAFLGRLS